MKRGLLARLPGHRHELLFFSALAMSLANSGRWNTHFMIWIFPFIGSLFLFVGCSKGPSTDVATKAVLRWSHPQLQSPKVDVIEDPKVASKLLSAFDGILQPQQGNPHDTPFYDLSIEFQLRGGTTVVTSVYLPREQVFPGMWKHPTSKALNYFDPDKGGPETVVSVLKAYLPNVYPATIDRSKPVPFRYGIPDFTKNELPIKGDFRPAKSRANP